MSLTDSCSEQRAECSNQYGIYQADLSINNQPGAPKASAGFYRNLVRMNGFETKSSVMGRTSDEDEFLYEQFPKDFLWGAATAAYQIEGGWNEGGLLLF